MQETGDNLGTVQAAKGKARRIAVNSLHNQGVNRLAPGLVVDAQAADGTVEAMHVRHSPGFAVGVQWHPEYDWDHDDISRGIFAAFADAVRARMALHGMQQAAE